MSYAGYRKPLRTRSQLISSGRFVSKLKKERRKPKPAWDDSVNDLTVHKLTSQELERNHELHQPKKDHERLLRKIESSKAYLDATDDSNLYCEGGRSPFEIAQRNDALVKGCKKQQAFLQERELHDLLSETDKTFAEMNDMFGDNLYKYKSIPTFTKAPNFTKDIASNISFMERDNPTHYDTLSESIVKELNAYSLSDEEDSINSNIEEGSTKAKEEHETAFQTKVNIDHYQNLLSQNPGKVYQSSNEINFPYVESLTEELTESIKRNNVNSNSVTNCAMENTKTCKENATTALQTFDDMKKMLDSLEGEIMEYEKETGKENITKKVTVPSSISGYTATLLSVITRLTHHLKHSEVQLKAEMRMRTEILDMFDDQRSMIEVLTTNMMELQESNEALKKELSTQRNVCQANHANLKKEIENLEARSNLTLFYPNCDQKIHQSQRKPFDNLTNHTQVMPVWTEDKQ